MKILGVTLARGGSKGIPHKNIKMLAGLPLISYTLREAKKSKMLTDYIVSTDDPDIRAVCLADDVAVPFLRPATLSTDNATSADALLHALNYMETQHNCDYDYVVELMATNPLKTVEDIDGCIKYAIANNADSCVAVREVFDEHPSRVKYIENGVLKPFYPEIPESRRQDLKPQAYIRCGSIYVVTPKFLKANNSRYSELDTVAYILKPEHVVNIDEPIDFELARLMIQKCK